VRTRLLLGVLAIVSLVAVFTTRVAHKMPDFEVYWKAGARAAAAEPLYRESDGHFQFKYLPAFALIASPIARVPLGAAKAAWFAASAVLMVVLLGLSLAALPDVRRPPPILLVLTFLAMAKFYAHELVLGQVNMLFGVLVALALVWMRRGRDVPAGALLALAVVVKPYAVIFAPWLATRRRKEAFLAMGAGVVILLLVPALRYGWQGNLALLADWWHTVTASSPPNLVNQDNVSLSAMFTKWLGPGSPAPILAAVAGAILLVITGIVMAGRGALKVPDTLEGSLLLLLIPLLSPQGWDYVFLIGTPAVMLLINYLPALPRELRYATIASIAIVALAIFDLMGREMYSAFMRASVITVLVIVEFAALVTLRFRRAA
jgi:alpha-1,2-mannosyltransferase